MARRRENRQRFVLKAHGTSWSDAVKRARNDYVDYFESVVQRASNPIVEPVLLTKDGTVAVEGELEIGVRLDLLERGPEGMKRVRIDSGKIPEFAPVTAMHRDVEVQLTPFVWDAVTFAMMGLNERYPVEGLRRWFLKWFDSEDQKAAQPTGVFELVHFLSDPRLRGSETTVSADLGTAPVEAFEELLNVLIDLRPRRISIRAS